MFLPINVANAASVITDLEILSRVFKLMSINLLGIQLYFILFHKKILKQCMLSQVLSIFFFLFCKYNIVNMLP